MPMSFVHSRCAICNSLPNLMAVSFLLCAECWRCTNWQSKHGWVWHGKHIRKLATGCNSESMGRKPRPRGVFWGLSCRCCCATVCRSCRDRHRRFMCDELHVIILIWVHRLRPTAGFSLWFGWSEANVWKVNSWRVIGTIYMLLFEINLMSCDIWRYYAHNLGLCIIIWLCWNTHIVRRGFFDSHDLIQYLTKVLLKGLCCDASGSIKAAHLQWSYSNYPWCTKSVCYGSYRLCFKNKATWRM